MGRGGGRVLHGAPDHPATPIDPQVLYALCTPEKLYSFGRHPEQLSTYPGKQEVDSGDAGTRRSPPLVCTHSNVMRCCACLVAPLRRICRVIRSGSARIRAVTAFAPVGIMLPPATAASQAFGAGSVPVAGGSFHSVCTVTEATLLDTPVEQAAEVAARLEQKNGEEVTSGGLVSRETSATGTEYTP